jgi:cell division protein FtsI (penicillin-binding protein 3)
LQVVNAVSCLANKGWWTKPVILKGVRDEEGKVVQVPAGDPVRRVISEGTCETLTRMLESAVETGTGTAADIPGYQVAGKTGTAQKVDPVTKEYSHKLFCSSFVGFFPASAPQIAILVAIDEPMKEQLGGLVAAPVFREIARSIILYRNMSLPGTPAVEETSPLRMAKTGPSDRVR